MADHTPPHCTNKEGYYLTPTSAVVPGTLPRALAAFLRSGQVTRFSFHGNKDVRRDTLVEGFVAPSHAADEDAVLRAYVPEGVLAGTVTFWYNDRRPTRPDIQLSDADVCAISKSAVSAVCTGKSLEASAPPPNKIQEPDLSERRRHDTEVL